MKTSYGRSLASALGIAALTLALAACGPAPAPTSGVPGDGARPNEPETGARAILKYGDELTDLSTFPEPPPNKAGGIPPEDLTATPKPGGLVKLTAGTPVDPHFVAAASSGWQYRVYGSGLLRWDAKCNCPQPDLAESWTVAPDGLSYDFKLRQGVKFHKLPPVNGRAVTAEDIKWSLDRVSGLMESPGKQGIFFRRFENVKEIRVVDASTLRMVMKQQDVQILAEVMYDNMAVLPKEAAVGGDFSQVKTAIGSGPFQVEYGEIGGTWKLNRNPDYWDKDQAGRQLPYLDSIQIVAVSDNAARVAAFKSRQVDMLAIQYAPGRGLLGDPNVRYANQRGLVNGAIGVFMNMSKPPFNDVRARRAINLAIDRAELLDAVEDGYDAGFVVNHLGAWEPWQWSEAKMWTMPGYAKGDAKLKEIEEAKRLLAEAGYGSGLKLQYWSDANRDPEFEVLTAQLGKLGIGITLTTSPNNRYASATRESGRELAYAYQGGGHVPDYAITVAWLCNSVQNLSLYCDPEFDKLWFESRRTRETDKRLQQFEKMQQMLWDVMPMAPMLRRNTLHMSYKYVRGWRNHWYDLAFSNGHQMAYVWLDK